MTRTVSVTLFGTVTLADGTKVPVTISAWEHESGAVDCSWQVTSDRLTVGQADDANDVATELAGYVARVVGP